MAFVFPSADIEEIIHGDGVPVRDSVRIATTANGTLATAFADGQSVDGATLATGDRILLKDQTTGSENGIYIVQAAGAPLRAEDFISGADATLVRVWIEEGTTNAGTGWVQKTATTVGTALTWERYDVSGGTLPTVDELVINDDDQSHTYTIDGGALTASNKTVTLPAEAVWTTGGVTQTLVLDAGTQTLTNKTLTSPIVNEILGAGGDEVLILTDAGATAVNEITIANANTTVAPRISATGDDANISLELLAKGTGNLDVLGGQTELRLYDADDSDYIGLVAAAATTSYSLTMPAAQGSIGQVLINSDGSGTMAWGAPTPSPVTGISLPFRVNVFNTTYRTIGYLAWDESTYGSFASTSLTYECVIGDRDLDIRLEKTTGTTATLVSDLGVAASKIDTLTSATDPVDDGRLEIQVRKSAAGGTNPIIYGVYVIITTT